MNGLNGYDREARIRLVWAVAIVLLVLVSIQLVDNRLSFIRGGDAYSYVLLAKSIATGAGYADINMPGAPPHTQYPPLLPALFAPLYMLFGYSFVLMRVVVILSGLAALFVVKRLFDEDEGYKGVMLAVLTGTNFTYLFFAKELMSEVPYAFFSMLALYVFSERYEQKRPRSRLLLFCLMVSIAYLTRMIGVTLWAAALVVLALDASESGVARKSSIKKLLLVAVAGGAAFVAWMLWSNFATGGAGSSTYQSIFAQKDFYSLESGGAGIGGLASRAHVNIGYYTSALPKALLTSSELKDVLPAVVLKLFMAVLFICTLAGFVREVARRKGRGIKEVYTFLYFALLVVWPVYGSGDARRYMVPMVPLIYFYFISGLTLAVRIVRPSSQLSVRPGPILVVPFLVLLLMNLVEIREMLNPVRVPARVVRSAAMIATGLTEKVEVLTPKLLGSDYFAPNAPCWTTYIDAAFYLKGLDKGKGGDVVMTRKPEIVALITGGHVVRFPYTGDEEAMTAFINSMGVRYVLLDNCYSEAEQYAVPYIMAHQKRFRLLLTDRKGTSLLRYQSE